MLKNAQTFEIMRPEDVGVKETSLVMGKHSGRAAFRSKLQELGYDLGDNALNDVFKRFKDLADRKKQVFDDDIVALVEDEVATASEAIKVIALTVIAGTGGSPKAIVTLDVDGEQITREATGDGPVDAMFKAVRLIAPHEGKLQLYQVGAVTEDSDAQAEVSVRLGEGDKMVTGRGADTDTMIASAKAYVSAVNKLVTRRAKSKPEELKAG
jgi:2-isopropylmalate synthase